jgi:hypothetical protein
LLGCSALAESDLLGKRSFANVFERQSGAFQPPTVITGSCSAGKLECGPKAAATCYLPSAGDTCCAGGYACPGGSFCLIDGYCCIDGLSPETCALQYSVSLPPGFKTGAQSTIPPATSVHSTGASTAATTTPVGTKTATSIVTSVSTHGHNISVSATATVPTPKPFTGAASRLESIGGITAMLLGVAGIVGHILQA